MTPKPSGDRRSKSRPGVEEQRAVITRAAIDLFCANGTQVVSISQICTRADVSRPTFYRCFSDKDALVEEIYEQAVNAHVGAVLYQGRLDQLEKLATELERMLDAIFAQAQLAQLIFREASNPQSNAAKIVERDFDRAAAVLARQLRKRNGTAPSKVYLKSVMAAIQWIVQDAIQKGLTAKAKKEARNATLDLITRALRSAPREVTKNTKR